MITREVTYKDPFGEGEEITELLQFHLTEAEMRRMMLDHKDLRGEIARIGRGEASNKEISDFFEDFVSRAYGERQDKRWLKSKDMTDAFLVSEAYSALTTPWFYSEDGA